MVVELAVEMTRGAPDPDPVGYPVDLVDPVQMWIRPDPTSQDPVWIRIRGRIRPDPNFCICSFPTSNNTFNFRRLLPVSI